MTDAPREIALHWRPGLAVTSGPLKDHPEYTRYIRADALTLADCRDVPEVRELVDACKRLGLRELVAGWNGEGRDKPYEPHPPHLWAKITTTTGVVYAIDAALRKLEGGGE